MKDIKEIEERLRVYKKLLNDNIIAYNLLSIRDKNKKNSEYQIERLKSIIEILEWIIE